MASSIKKRVRDLIRSVDLEQFTERKLRKQLGEEFGQSQVEEHGALIKETVNSELERLAEHGAEDEGAKDKGPPCALTNTWGSTWSTSPSSGAAALGLLLWAVAQRTWRASGSAPAPGRAAVHRHAAPDGAPGTRW